DLYFLDGSDQFLWTSEGSGYRHIYLYDNDGTLARQVTSGDWVVSDIEDYDEAEGVVYFHGLYDTPLERHLYKVSYKESGADITRLTAEAGWHDTVTNLGSGFVDSYSASDVPPRIALKNMAGELITYIQENPLDETHPYYAYLNTHARAIFGTLRAADGTDLHYRLIRRAGFDCDARHPLIVFVYGGPGVQQVRNRWLLDFNQILARNGYVVLTVDNRGSINRGTAFEGVLYRSMGDTEVRDQVAGVNFFTEIGMIDPARVGIWGWSYGGYMTLMSLSKAGEVFKAGVSVAPVTDWRLYDTHYTERYLGDPNAPGGVYAESSVFKHLDGLSGSLLVMHGMADDNVVFDHTVKLIDELQNRRKTFQMMTYPGKRHRISGEDTRAHVWRTALDFFNKELRGE
ncbi:MAG: prolyl oligopeptidase family serine peptidase, partial [Sphingomonadales bacterium]